MRQNKKIQSHKRADLSSYAGKWVVLKDDEVIASGKTFKEIETYVIRSEDDATPIEKLPAAFKVPRKDEGPYVLVLYGISVSGKR